MSVDQALVQSIRQRLTNLARASGEDVQRMLVRYAIERLLYRISVSKYAPRFVLKGATLFSLWTEAPFRSTGDLDLLGQGENGIDAVKRIFGEIAALDSDPPDGLVFDTAQMRTDTLRADANYSGVSLRFDALLGRARLPIMVDIGYGDVITPAPTELEFPTLLAMPAAKLKAYPPETVIAEKVEAMTSLGLANSRVKDLYDLWAIAQTFDFEGAVLADAVKATFTRRGTALDGATPAMLTRAYTEDPTRQQLWRAFLQGRTEIENAPADLTVIARDVEVFVAPILAAASSGDIIGNWQSKETAWTT